MLQTGDRTELLPSGRGSPYGWEHTLTQMWFIDLWPHPINRVLRLENLDEELKKMQEYFGLKGKSDVVGYANVAEGRRKSSPALEGAVPPSGTYHPRDVAKLVNGYLKQDYECLQYPKPDINGVTFRL